VLKQRHLTLGLANVKSQDGHVSKGGRGLNSIEGRYLQTEILKTPRLFYIYLTALQKLFRLPTAANTFLEDKILGSPALPSDVNCNFINFSITISGFLLHMMYRKAHR
jgi:hypothetical protein